MDNNKKNTKIKICMLLFSSGMGGGEQSVYNLIKGIDKKKFEIYLITNRLHLNNFKNLVKPSNIFTIRLFYKVSNYKIIRFLKRYISKVFDFKKIIIKKRIKDILKFINNNNINILHSHLTYDLYLSSIIKQQIKNIKTIYTVRSFINFDDREKISYGLNKRDTISSLSKIDYFTFISDSLGSFMNEKFSFINKNNSIIIENSLLEEDFRNIKIKSNNKDVKIISFFGGEKKVKGGKYLIEALQIFDRKYPEIRYQFQVFGKVKNKNKFYNQQKTEKIRIMGYMSKSKILDYMNSSDIVVMPSISEGFGNVAQEAKALNVPIIVSNIPALTNIIENKKNGLICELNPSLIADSIYELLTNIDLINTIKTNSNSVNWIGDKVREFEQIYNQIN